MILKMITFPKELTLRTNLNKFSNKIYVSWKSNQKCMLLNLYGTWTKGINKEFLSTENSKS
jgi:hypothetical protein